MRPPRPAVRLGCILAGLTLLGGGAAVHAETGATAGDSGVVVTTRITDPQDTPGSLDIVSVTHVVGERTDTATLRYTVTMDRRFDPVDLHRRHRHVVAELGTGRERGATRNITIYHRDGELRADLISNATREVIAVLPVRLLAGRQLRVRGSRAQIGVRRIFWYSNYHGQGRNGCGRQDGYPVTCQDTVPDRGWLHLPRSAWPD